jgi:hypothetical protein
MDATTAAGRARMKMKGFNVDFLTGRELGMLP